MRTPIRRVSLVVGLAICAAEASIGGGAAAQTRAGPPNIVVVFVDDMGYGDIGPFGHPTIHTPNLDRMAAEGTRFTQFYVGAAVCTPSRAALLTGRYPIRTGLVQGRLMPGRVLFPGSEQGLPPEEITVAEVLSDGGYATAAIGKWHLGDHAPFLPTQQGFDTFFGIPYSNDMDWVGPTADRAGYSTLPLLRDREIVERPADQHTLTRRFTEEAVQFIREHCERPFFLYLAHPMPHIPLFASPEFTAVSSRGLYGDVIEELDWSVGQVMEALRQNGVAENTLLIFTSDNGPWLVQREAGGSAGLLRGGKTSTWEGGVRVPMIAWWPGTVPAGRTTRAVATAMDLLPTAAALAGLPLPDRTLDGRDLGPVLRGETDAHHDFVAFYRGTRLFAARLGPWKTHFLTQEVHPMGPLVAHDPPLLYHLEHDPEERFELSERHPDVIADIRERVAAHAVTIADPPGPDVEAEELIGRVTVTAGHVEVQDMSGHDGKWSGGAQLRWVLAGPGDRLTIPIDVPAAGTHQLIGYFTRARDHGIIRLHLGGAALRPLVDGYAPEPEPTAALLFDPVELPAGTAELVVEILGKDARSAGYGHGYLVGLDGFTLRRVEP